MVSAGLGSEYRSQETRTTRRLSFTASLLSSNFIFFSPDRKLVFLDYPNLANSECIPTPQPLHRSAAEHVFKILPPHVVARSHLCDSRDDGAVCDYTDFHACDQNKGTPQEHSPRKHLRHHYIIRSIDRTHLRLRRHLRRRSRHMQQCLPQ